MLNQLISSLTDGLLLGFVYGVAAMGLTLIWGVMSVINLAHGPVIAMGMFGTYLLFTHLGVNPYLAMVPVAGAGLIVGLVIYVISVHRVINAPHLSSLLSTFAVNMIIIGVGTAVFTTSPQNIDYSLGSVEVGFLTFPASPLVGAVGYQWLRGYLLTSPIFKDLHLAVAGAMLLLIILFVPAGVVGWVRSHVRRLQKVLE